MVVVGRTGRLRVCAWATRRSLKGAGLAKELSVRALMRSEVVEFSVTLAAKAVQALSRAGKMVLACF